MTGGFNRLTREYIDETDIAHRKVMGQYFTPRHLREHLLSKLPRARHATILDPACGTGEFLLSAMEHFPDSKLYGWEIDPRLVRISREAVPEAVIKRRDSLKAPGRAEYDFIIGNPPYFECKPDTKLRKRFDTVISGRANIFSMFVQLGLELLKPAGYLAYVIPPSLNNGAYFSGLRRYIVKQANIECLSVQESSALFDQAQQTVMIMVLRKGRNNGDYVFTKNRITIFSTNVDKLRRAFTGKTTLRDLGLTVRTGKIVWNQHRDKLTNHPSRAVPLIRARNITPGGLVLDNAADTPQYIRANSHDTGPAIVVNRVTGAASRVRLKAALIEPGVRFLGENHVNVIYPPDGTGEKKALTLLRKICRQINTPKTMATMKLITGNTQISRTELECLMPLSI